MPSLNLHLVSMSDLDLLRKQQNFSLKCGWINSVQVSKWAESWLIPKCHTHLVCHQSCPNCTPYTIPTLLNYTLLPFSALLIPYVDDDVVTDYGLQVFELTRSGAINHNNDTLFPNKVH